MQSAISLVAAVAAATAQPSADDQAQAMLAKGDVNRAIPLFEASAGQGNAAAAYNLGRIYSLGEGQAVNRGQALRWFRKAADEGNPGAAYQLGLAYREGLGVSRDSAAAARWFQKAANQGYADAEVRLGGLYARAKVWPRTDPKPLDGTPPPQVMATPRLDSTWR